MRTWTYEKACEWRREYKRRRWREDPEYRKRHNEVANASAKRRRQRMREFKATFYPFGFRRPLGITSPIRIMQAFASHLEEKFSDSVSHAYLANPFDPFRPDAPELFQMTLNGAAEFMNGSDPVLNSRTPNAIIRYYNRNRDIPPAK